MQKNLNFSTNNLLGKWKIKRLIFDYYADNKFSFIGNAIITDYKNYKNNYLFSEYGKLFFDKKVFNSTKSYRLNKVVNRWEIFHSNSSLFFSLNGTKTRQSIYHRCLEDEYKGDFRITSRESFTIIWHVIGPHKTYYSKSIYKKHLHDQ